MTEPEILELPAREMDALVAEKVMGECYHQWEWDDSVEVSPEPGWVYFSEKEWLPDYAWKCTRCEEMRTSSYPSLKPKDGGSFTPSSMMAVVDRMQKLGYLLDLRICPKETTAKFFTVDHECAMVVLSEFARSHEDPKLAVILAALDARGVIE